MDEYCVLMLLWMFSPFQIATITAAKADAMPYHPVRLVVVFASEQTRRGSRAIGSRTGPSCGGKLRLATDLLTITAELITEAYLLRWLIEVCQADCKSSAGLFQLTAIGRRSTGRSRRASLVETTTILPSDCNAIALAESSPSESNVTTVLEVPNVVSPVHHH